MRALSFHLPNLMCVGDFVKHGIEASRGAYVPVHMLECRRTFMDLAARLMLHLTAILFCVCRACDQVMVSRSSSPP